ncbi:MAG TPA: NfeD family protein [Ktedonobacterales bacterium]
MRPLFRLTPRTPRSLTRLITSAFTLAALFAGLTLAQASLATLFAPHARAAAPHVDVVAFSRDVDPAGARYLTDAIQTAESDGANALIITIDTPGGDIASMQNIVSAELAARIPIISYVSPDAAQAASAGSFIALAAPVAVMAPNTRIGAASPVDVNGGDLGSTLKAKVEQDLEALMRSIQTSYHRNIASAESMISSATAFTDTEALSDGIISLRASSLNDLMNQLTSYNGIYSNGDSFTLNLSGLPTQTLQPSLANTIEAYLFDPNTLFLLFVIAAICIYLEIAHPGAIVPGVVGALTLAVFLIGSLGISPNWGGLALMLLAIALLAVDTRAPTHGVLTVGALVSLVSGALIFFDTGSNPGAPGVNLYVVIGVAIGVGLIALLVLRAIISAQRRRVTTGTESYAGQIVLVIEPVAPTGRVALQGENWAARLTGPADQPIPAGAYARVVGVQGLTLLVEPSKAAATSSDISAARI